MKPSDSLKSKTSTMDDEKMYHQEPILHQTLTMDVLAERISFVDESLRQQTAHAVNCMLTARNYGNRDGSPIRLAERIGEPSQFPLEHFILFIRN